MPLQHAKRLAPVIDFIAHSPANTSLTSQVRALVDTGATITCVPEKVIADLGRRNLWATRIKVSGAFGPKLGREAYLIDIRLANCYFHKIEVVVLPSGKDYAIVGRDILNRYRIIFDGPRQSWVVDAKC